jgi:hypothetical protein
MIETSVFGLYEIFSNIMPGLILLVTLWEFVGSFWHAPILTLDSNVLLVFFVLLSFILGVAIQALSAPFEKWVFTVRHRGYPSSKLLDADDITFPDDFKKRIRRLVHAHLGISRSSTSQQIFDLCYTYLVQNNISRRVTMFLNMYSFCRNMSVAMLAEAAVLFIWGALGFPSLVVFGLLSTVLAFLFYHRSVRYSFSFATEVFRGYYVDQMQGERQKRLAVNR